MSEHSLRSRIWAVALAAAAVVAVATPSSAQLAPETSSSAQTSPDKARSAVAKKKKKPAPTPDLAPSVAATPAPSGESGNAQATQAQNPLSPIFSLPNQNNTNGGVGPLRRTQNVLLVEPIIPIKLTPDWNLVTRWISPVISEPRLTPTIGPEFGLGNITPQFFFTPAHPGSFIWALGPQLWLPTATDKTLGVNRFGGGPAGVALTIQGPWLVGVLANNIWAGSHGSSATGQRINTMTIEPIVFYNLPHGGWYLCSIPVITADWTVDAHNRWTVPLGGGFGRVFKVGDTPVNTRFQAFYNGAFAPAAGITNTGKWTVQFLLHFLLPEAPVPTL